MSKSISGDYATEKGNQLYDADGQGPAATYYGDRSTPEIKPRGRQGKLDLNEEARSALPRDYYYDSNRYMGSYFPSEDVNQPLVQQPEQPTGGMIAPQPPPLQTMPPLIQREPVTSTPVMTPLNQPLVQPAAQPVEQVGVTPEYPSAPIQPVQPAESLSVWQRIRMQQQAISAMRAQSQPAVVPVTQPAVQPVVQPVVHPVVQPAMQPKQQQPVSQQPVDRAPRSENRGTNEENRPRRRSSKKKHDYTDKQSSADKPSVEKSVDEQQTKPKSVKSTKKQGTTEQKGGDTAHDEIPETHKQMPDEVEITEETSHITEIQEHTYAKSNMSDSHENEEAEGEAEAEVVSYLSEGSVYRRNKQYPADDIRNIEWRAEFAPYDPDRTDMHAPPVPSNDWTFGRECPAFYKGNIIGGFSHQESPWMYYSNKDFMPILMYPKPPLQTLWQGTYGLAMNREKFGFSCPKHFQVSQSRARYSYKPSTSAAPQVGRKSTSVTSSKTYSRRTASSSAKSKRR